LPESVTARVSVEQASTLGWARYVGRRGHSIGMETFGASAPLKELQKKFGFIAEHIVLAAKDQIANARGSMRIAIGSDHAGFALKEEVKAFLVGENHQVLDVGTHSKEPVDYPDYAEAVGEELRKYRAERGIIVCGSGVGASMAANRIPGIRAGLCHDT